MLAKHRVELEKDIFELIKSKGSVSIDDLYNIFKYINRGSDIPKKHLDYVILKVWEKSKSFDSVNHEIIY